MTRFQQQYVFTFVMIITFLSVAAGAMAQTPAARTPRPSQKASVTQTIGVTDVTITFSRPGVKARKIWGEAPAGSEAGTATLDDQYKRPKDAVIVPFGHVWRSGANEATTFTVTDDVMINGQKLAAGTYSLHTIPGQNEWTIIFNSDAGQWGSFRYDEKRDALRVKSKPQWVADNQEWLLYSIPVVTPNSAQVVLRWEKVAVSFSVEVPNVEAVMRARAEELVSSNPGDWRIPLAIGAYYADDNKPEEALKWIDQSVKIKETFQNLSARARSLVAAGRRDEGLAVANQAILRGKADKVDVSRFEKWLADLGTGKM